MESFAAGCVSVDLGPYLNGDNLYEILFLASGLGRIFVLSHAGEVVKRWDAGDWKLGNTPVIIDADHDGILDGYLGTRSKYLVRLNCRILCPWLDGRAGSSVAAIPRRWMWTVLETGIYLREPETTMARREPYTVTILRRSNPFSPSDPTTMLPAPIRCWLTLMATAK